MLTWSHGAFRKRLKMRVGENRLPDCKEDYTSKTCVRCGKLNHKLGGKRVFDCDDCGLTIGRDCGGAVGILLKNLSLTRFVSFGHTGGASVPPGMGLGPFSSILNDLFQF
jgi:putative transposase